MDAAEADLLARARGGNLFAFEEIVKRYQRRVYATALRIVRRHDVADDVVQEAFLRAYQALDRFDLARPVRALDLPHRGQPGRQPRALARGARGGAARRRTRRRRRRAASPLGGVLDDGGAARCWTRALERLSAEQRAVFVLRVFEELSYQEIAEALEHLDRARS